MKTQPPQPKRLVLAVLLALLKKPKANIWIEPRNGLVVR
jgi:hypothetical protein